MNLHVRRSLHQLAFTFFVQGVLLCVVLSLAGCYSDPTPEQKRAEEFPTWIADLGLRHVIEVMPIPNTPAYEVVYCVFTDGSHEKCHSNEQRTANFVPRQGEALPKPGDLVFIQTIRKGSRQALGYPLENWVRNTPVPLAAPATPTDPR